MEVDGFRYHASRPDFERDRRNDAELVAGGVTVLRLSWHQITAEPVATAVRLGQALAHAASRAKTPSPGRRPTKRGPAGAGGVLPSLPLALRSC